MCQVRDTMLVILSAPVVRRHTRGALRSNFVAVKALDRPRARRHAAKRWKTERPAGCPRRQQVTAVRQPIAALNVPIKRQRLRGGNRMKPQPYGTSAVSKQTRGSLGGGLRAVRGTTSPSLQ
jgi:hypothetical protein